MILQLVFLYPFSQWSSKYRIVHQVVLKTPFSLVKYLYKRISLYFTRIYYNDYMYG